MTSILDQLHTDHINAVKLLELFEKELEEYKKPDSEPNYFKWQNILLYMTAYQDVFHHPAEEKLFAYVSTDDLEVSQAIEKVESQHERLYQKSKNLHGMLGDVETNFITMERVDLIKACKSYIDLLKEHMSLEERVIFPFARRKMQENDWSAFEKGIVYVADPLFGEKKRAEFIELYQSVYAQ